MLHDKIDVDNGCDYVLYNRPAIQDPLPLPRNTSPKEYGISIIGRRSKKRHK